MGQETAGEATAGQREQAAFLVAEDRLTDDAIAAKLGIGRSTLARWKKQESFKARVAARRADLASHVFEQGIANKAVRLADYDELRRRLWSTIIARGESALAARATGDLYGRMPAPGAENGLMVKRIVPGGKGLAEEWAVDAAVITEIRALDKQAAQEAGQWTEKQELTGGTTVIFESVVPGLQPADMAHADRQLQALAAGDAQEGSLEGGGSSE